MMWRWLICFSVALSALRAGAGPVAGTVEIVNSQDPTVRRNKDYTGVVLWLEPVDGTGVPAPAPRHERMIQKNKHFLPHVMAVTVGSTVDFPNLDPIYHNAFSNFSGQTFDTGLYKPGTSKSEQFKTPGIVRVFCNIHPTMSAIIAVLPTPLFAVTDASGRFSIPGVPPGDYELRIFHERSLPEVLRFLERRITVPDGGLKLPLISISETGYIPAVHLNKYGREYPPVANDSTYPGARK
jgi:plastocyanin